MGRLSRRNNFGQPAYNPEPQSIVTRVVSFTESSNTWVSENGSLSASPKMFKWLHHVWLLLLQLLVIRSQGCCSSNQFVCSTPPDDCFLNCLSICHCLLNVLAVYSGVGVGELALPGILKWLSKINLCAFPSSGLNRHGFSTRFSFYIAKYIRLTWKPSFGKQLGITF